MAKPLLVIIHLYYLDQVDRIIALLKNIDYPYDLYCTIANEKAYSQIQKKLETFSKNVHIVKTANVGYDVWPFVNIINNIDLNNYSYVIKLHTKRDMPGSLPCPLGNGFMVGTGNRWREDLYAFLSSKSNLHKCIDYLQNEHIGMCTRYNLIHGMADHCGVITDAKLKWSQYIFGLNDFCFVAGTMFISKIAPIQLIKDMHIDENLFDVPDAEHTTQFAHVIERTLGEAVYKLGMIIDDPFTSKKHIIKIKKRYFIGKCLHRMVNYIVFFIPIAKIRRKCRQKLINFVYIPYVKRSVNMDNISYKNNCT